MWVYEIIHKVQEANRGICTRLSERSRKSKQIYQAHAAEPFTLNAENYGKPSPADHYVDYCEEYEAAVPGAGLLLSEMIAAELRFRFTNTDMEFSQRTMRRDLVKEFSEALDALDQNDFEDADIRQMKAIQVEVQEMVNKGSQVVGHLIAIIRQKEMDRASKKTVERFGRKAA